MFVLIPRKNRYVSMEVLRFEVPLGIEGGRCYCYGDDIGESVEKTFGLGCARWSVAPLTSSPLYKCGLCWSKFVYGLDQMLRSIEKTFRRSGQAVCCMLTRHIAV